MPAVTADPLTLTRLPRLPDKETAWRPVTRVVTATRHLEGEGFEVRRPFPGVDLSLADPFLLLDHMGAVEYAPGEAKGTPWHPHRGFETVTYIIDGAFEHQDTTGGGGLITDGATQWMTAGAGIQHIEQPRRSSSPTGGLFHGVQLWVNLPRAAEVGAAALPGHRGPRRDAAVQRRRLLARPGDRRRAGRAQGPGRDATRRSRTCTRRSHRARG